MFGFFIIPAVLILGGLAAATGVFDIDVDEGTTGDDAQDGGSGDDLLRGDEGNDVIEGGSGADALSGDQGNDIVAGQQDNDTVVGAADADVVTGGGGDDQVFGGGDTDLLLGNQGNDVLLGGGGEDVILGGEGDDSLFGERGNDILIGGNVDGLNPSIQQLVRLRDDAVTNGFFARPEDDFVDVQDSGSDTMDGGLGADTLFIGAGDEVLGGEGPDTFAILPDQEPGDVPRIFDYDDTKDVIAIVADPEAPEPDIRTAGRGDDVVVFANDQPVVRVLNANGRLVVDDIVVMEPAQVGDFNPF
ncbi:MAG: calcium-binding protein [Pseudomonadota bacterium]